MVALGGLGNSVDGSLKAVSRLRWSCNVSLVGSITETCKGSVGSGQVGLEDCGRQENCVLVLMYEMRSWSEISCGKVGVGKAGGGFIEVEVLFCGLSACVVGLSTRGLVGWLKYTS